MGAEGIPYELAEFQQLGVVNDSKGLDEGEAWRPEARTKPVRFRGEFPID